VKVGDSAIREGLEASDSDLGYYVRYSDGFESWFPTKVFEVEYVLLDVPAAEKPEKLAKVPEVSEPEPDPCNDADDDDADDDDLSFGLLKECEAYELELIGLRAERRKLRGTVKGLARTLVDAMQELHLLRATLVGYQAQLEYCTRDDADDDADDEVGVATDG